MRKISILGSTGSIGTQTLEVVENLGDIRVAAITGNKNIALLEKQARKFHPELIAVMNAENAKALQSRLSDTKIRIVSGNGWSGRSGYIRGCGYSCDLCSRQCWLASPPLQQFVQAKISRLRIKRRLFPQDSL